MTMARMACFTPEAAQDVGSGDQIVAGWQHVFHLLGKHAKCKPASIPPACELETEKTPLPFVAMSPFGGYYFGPRR